MMEHISEVLARVTQVGIAREIAERLKLSAEALAAKVGSEEYAVLDVEERAGLRWLTLHMLKWADALDPERAPFSEGLAAIEVIEATGGNVVPMMAR